MEDFLNHPTPEFLKTLVVKTLILLIGPPKIIAEEKCVVLNIPPNEIILPFGQNF